MGITERLIVVKEMVAAGFDTRIVGLEVKLPRKVIRKVYVGMQDTEGLSAFHGRPGKEPSGLKLIKNVSTKLHASFVTGIYRAVGGKGAFVTCDLKALSTAFRVYLAELKRIEGHALFDINDLWWLVKELKERSATIEKCQVCTCRYFHSINQRANVDCPFCFRTNSKANGDATDAC